jgi:O-antigen ligase
MLGPLASWLFACTLMLCPLVGMCVVTLAGGRSLGVGVQPAYVTLGALILVLLAAALRGRRARGHRCRPWGPGGWVLLAAVLWTVAGVSALWRLDDVGLAGEAPWAKGLKQSLLLLLHVTAACAPVWVLRCSPVPRRELQRWERGATIGLALAAAYGLLQAATFYVRVPGASHLARWVTCNPSLASGSHELYLGHRFVGIPRIYSTGCEPLYFASYLLAAVPVAWAAAARTRGVGRLARLAAATAGTICFVLTFARGAYLGAAVLVALVVAGMAHGQLPRPAPRRAALGGALLVVGIASGAGLLAGVAPWQMPALLARRLAQSFAAHDMSNLTRLFAWRAALLLARRHPLAGVGWGGFGFWFYRVTAPGEEAAHFGWPTSNSLPLLILAETGLVGLILWGAAVRRPLAALRLRGGPPAGGGRAEAYLLACALAAVLTQMLTFHQIHLLHPALLIGVTAAVAGRLPSGSRPERLV